MKRRTFTIVDAGPNPTLGEVVGRELEVAAVEASRLIAAGAVYLQGRRTLEPGTRVARGQKVTIVLEEAGVTPTAATPEPQLQVLFEDRDLVAVMKPAGIASQPTPSRVGASLVDLVSRQLGREAGLVHRLDRETSGVIVFGKTREATSALAAAFREGTANKRYLAATGPKLPGRGEIDLPLSRDPSRPGRWRATRQANGVPALTRYERLFAAPEFALVALYPQTGRTHQLRAHLRALDAPILGDLLYGGEREAQGVKAPRCLLHAAALALPHPRTGAPVLLEATPPEDLAAFFRVAGVPWPTGPIRR